MGTAIQTTPPNGSLGGLDETTMHALVTGGDCSRLTPAQKTAYYVARCEAAGLDPRAQPFAFVRLNGKEVLYAQKAAADQLAAKHGVRLSILSQATEDGIRIVTVRAEAKDGRVTEEIGALPIKGLTGEALSNALMKTVTKAKRRAVLSLCGLGMLDETEVESIPHAEPAPEPRVVEAEVVADSRKAPPVEAAKTVEEKKPAGPPPYVLALWNRVKKAQGEDKARSSAGTMKTQAALKKGAEEAGVTKPSSEWTPDECAKVSEAIFGDHSDIPF